ncbi:MAG: hypothetical protein DRQ57_11445 [Gammaproteobacteria bacterium]|nr:MAG: hypothetical protein DRQ57_11445 [Gammaproteobacteria bacterium]
MNNQKIPLTLAITGHRDPRPADWEILSASVRNIFRFLQQHYPHTPLQLLSPLADGADRLVAQAALAEKVQLIVPLPMPQTLFESDFDADSQKEFQALLEQASQIFTLPLVAGNTEENIANHGHHRTQQYGLGGAYVARHSHILIALWDGVDLGKIAGTAEIVKFKRTGNMKGLAVDYQPPTSSLDSPDMGPICQVVTPRAQTKQPAFAVGDIRILLPHSQDSDNLEDLLSDELAMIELFNQDVKRYANHAKVQKTTESTQKNLIPPKLWQDLPNLVPGFQNLLGVYGSANSLAKHFQTRIKHLSFTVLMMAFAMVGFYGWYANIDHNRPLTLGIYAVLFIGALLIVSWVKWRRYHHKALDYRALAEGLRIQIFWHLSGLKYSVSDYYLRKQRQELAWIRSSIRALNVYDWVTNQQTPDVVRNRWVLSETGWFTKTAKQKKQSSQRLNWTIKGLFGIGIVCMVGLWIDHVFGMWLWNYSILQTHPVWHNLLILLIALFPAAGALLHHYLETMAFAEEAKQYKRMAHLFKRADQQLQSQPQSAETDQLSPEQQLLFELGKEALAENGDWVLLHRKPPLRVPI